MQFCIKKSFSKRGFQVEKKQIKYKEPVFKEIFYYNSYYFFFFLAHSEQIINTGSSV